MSKNLSDFSTLSLDCYGTLIDWETGIWDALQPLIRRSGRDDVVRRQGLEAFARFENAREMETPELPYPEILQRTHADVAAYLGMTTSVELDREFACSIAHWPAFADTADALRRLRKHYKLVILSNVDRAGFAASATKLGVAFDAAYTAEDIRSYKPAAANFHYLIEHLQADLGVKREAILHTAQSLFHDHAPANAFDLANVWIDRQGLSHSDNWGATARLDKRPEVDFLFPTLAAMADAVEGEVEPPQS